ncbi:MAG: AgmX/PglI C-terminal domain-containing protein [Myxococcales bacterium]|nr:AgmX/PglI C-terminal domain-containing protein [Myxococcales bacterium]
MSDDYLWDRAGTPAPDELFLERLMPRLRDQVRRAAPSELEPPFAMRRTQRRPLLFFGLAATLVLAVGAVAAHGYLGSSIPIGIRGEPPTSNPAGAPITASAEVAPTTPTTRLVPSPSAAHAARAIRPNEAPRAPVVPQPRSDEPEKPAPAAIPSVSDAPPATAAEPQGNQRGHAEIQAVIAGHRSEVRQRCWEPALAKRSEHAATTVRLTVRFTIEANGKTSGASAGPASPDYPALAGCIAAETRGWRFGPAASAIAVNVPFVFTEAR